MITRFAHRHRDVVRELSTAAGSRDLQRLRSLLHPTIAVVVDRGAPGEPEIRVVEGVDEAAALLAHGIAAPQVVAEEGAVNSQAGLLLTRAGLPLANIAVDFTGALISLVWVRLHPVRLRHGNTI